MEINGSVYERLYPESQFASFHRRSLRFLFFSLVADLVEPTSVVVDYGAGRGAASSSENCYANWLANLRGRVTKVIGLDVDPIVTQNPTLDEAYVLAADGRIPLPDASVDLMFSCMVLEHVADPAQTVAEIKRVLRPGGWFCACTPNRWSYFAMGARLIPNAWHAALLSRVVGGRAAGDTFPTFYRMNTLRAVRRLFGGFRNCSFIYNGPPGYHFGSMVLARFWLLLMTVLPPSMGQYLFIFVQKPAPLA